MIFRLPYHFGGSSVDSNRGYVDVRNRLDGYWCLRLFGRNDTSS